MHNPLLKAVLTDDTGGLMPVLTTRADALLASAREHAVAHLPGRPPRPGRRRHRPSGRRPAACAFRASRAPATRAVP